jgi:hypothetical protein
MSAPAMASDAGAVVTPDARHRLRRARGPIIIVVLVLAVSLLLALAQSRGTRGLLDPDATDPRGAGALAALLREQGVEVVRVTTAQQAYDALYQADRTKTLLIAADRSPLSPDMRDKALQRPPDHLVVVGGIPEESAALAGWAQASFGDGTEEVPPGCTWDIAERVGPLVPAGVQYSSDDPLARICWEGLVADRPDDGTPGKLAATLIGNSSLLTNEKLADSGNAALGLNVLGRDQTVVWWLPSATDPLQIGTGDEPPSITDLVPGWVRIALLQLAIAVLVVVWWRGRRLGRVVVEPLPVVVRATETVEGRARLYRRAGARDRAAAVLRDRTTSRLRSLLGLPRNAGLDEVVPAVVARTGRDSSAVTALLAPGGTPLDDAGLTRLADALDTLEDEVRRS